MVRVMVKGVFRGARGHAPNDDKEWLPQWIIILSNGHTHIDGKHFTGCYNFNDDEGNAI